MLSDALVSTLTKPVTKEALVILRQDLGNLAPGTLDKRDSWWFGRRIWIAHATGLLSALGGASLVLASPLCLCAIQSFWWKETRISVHAENGCQENKVCLQE